MTKQRLFNMYWLWDARQGRGSGYLNELRLTTYIPVAGVILLLFPDLSRALLPFLVIGFLVVTYLLGYIDEKFIKYWHFDNEMQNTYDLNPYQRRLERRLINIETSLGVKSEPTPFDISRTDFEKEVNKI